MHISLNWLKDFIEIPKDLSPQELGSQLTLKTAEVEQVVEESKKFENMVVGQIVELKPHPDADKLQIAITSVGKENLQIVCGGQNLEEGMYVAVAKIGAVVDWHGKGEIIEMKKVKIRGVESYGMICAGSEIGVENTSEGPHDILDLSPLKPKVGQSLSELLEKNDVIFEIDNKSLTHRPDLWGHYGIAREISVITGNKLKKYEPKVQIPEKGESPKVEVKNKTLCQRYCGLIIENIKVESSPNWLQRRLKAVGHGTHNNIVDITNYVMAETGQPMHAFDKNYIKEKIVVRLAEKNEKFTDLKDNKHKLSDKMLIIADSEKAVAVAGVIGGKNSGINEKTTSIILESATFNSSSIRRTSTELGVRTDSVQRFEKSLDPNLAEHAIKRAAELILEICPEAKIAGPITDISNFDKKVPQIDLKIEKVISKIGIDIPTSEIIKILESLEFKIEKKDKENLKVTIPSFRATKDVDIEDDLIEEVARIYGYENIPAKLPSLPTKLPEENTDRFAKHRARELFSYGLGFNEVYNYSFYGNKELDNSLMNEESHLKLLNYLSEDQTHMRTTLTPNMLKAVHLNSKYHKKFKIYEIGRSYKDLKEVFPLEEKQIAGAVVEKSKKDKTFYEAKGAVEKFLEKFCPKKIKQVSEVKNTPYAHPYRAISYMNKDGKVLAKVFVIHPLVKKNFDLENYSVSLFEINFTEVQKSEKKEKKYQIISKFPNIEFDISVLVARDLEVGKIESAIKQADQNLISEVNLFDIYEGKNIKADKKAVAYNIVLQASDRTLTDEEMNSVQDKVFKNLEKIGGKIRGK